MTKFKGAHSEPFFTLLRTGMYTLKGEKSELADRANLQSLRLFAAKQLCRSAIRTGTPCGVRCVALSRASGVTVVWAVHGVSGVPIGALLVVLPVIFCCVCSSHVSGWLTSVEVFAVVPLGVSWFPSCRVGGHFCSPSERWGAGRLFIGTFGYRRPPRHARRSRVLGGREPVARVQMQWTINRHCLVFSK